LGSRRSEVNSERLAYEVVGLETQEQFLTPFFLCPGVGAAVFDEHFRFEALNDALATINGLSKRAHLGRIARKVLGPFVDEVEPYFHQVVTSSTSVIFEAGGRPGKRQKPGHFLVSYIPIRHEQSLKVFAFVLEVTHKRKLDEALFGLTGKLFYLKDNLLRSLLEIQKRAPQRWGFDARLHESVELIEKCSAEIADILGTIRPRIAAPGHADAHSQEQVIGLLSTSDGQRKPLSPREHEVLRLLASNKANKEIGVFLGISVRTVESHRRRIMEKLGIHSLAELVHYAIRHGLVEA
jgi:DNA-binding CsgD family transcriptional regulator